MSDMNVAQPNACLKNNFECAAGGALKNPPYVDPSVIPAVMRERKQWVLWKLEGLGRKPTKVPYQINGNKAKTNDADTWNTFDTVNSQQGYTGIGFCFGKDDGIVGIDLDHVITDGELDDWAKEYCEKFNGAYIERSPSGDGLHLFMLGSPVKTGSKKWIDESGKETGLEVYDYTSPRYLTVTGVIHE